ncbi:MAG: FeoB small GTPase domain-containing protein [Bacillota bacterium]|uniref:FeoB small GTPase domain-containing protein n=1 Tax=Desulforudis sp. DRI-14 TaxID=3459793 RepID=UPI00347766E0
MGLTSNACGWSANRETFGIKRNGSIPVIALAGNPNTGKTTVFNALTGLNQHTGNWPGKTVLRAEGCYAFNGREYLVVDLPGTYSLLASSAEEQVARDFLCLANPDATVVVVDATCLERNLNLVLQVLEITPRAIVAVNLIDEAARKNIHIDCRRLAGELGVPVVATAARYGKGIDELKAVIAEMAGNQLSTSPRLVTYDTSLERSIRFLEPRLKDILPPYLSARWAALRILEGDPYIFNTLHHFFEGCGQR